MRSSETKHVDRAGRRGIGKRYSARINTEFTQGRQTDLLFV